MSDSDEENFEDCYDALDTFEEQGMETGVKTNRTLSKHTLLGEYKGKKLTYLQAFKKMRNNYLHYIVKSHKENCYIDGEGVEGTILKFINHKCENSNCELVKLTNKRVGIITKRVVQAGETLNYNYNITYFDGETKGTIKCICHPDCPNYL